MKKFFSPISLRKKMSENRICFEKNAFGNEIREKKFMISGFE
jgi:hypothetical protein